MFSTESRYRNLSDVVATDGSGRKVKSKSLRILPKVFGNFLHTIQELDRLDHLGHQYYKQATKWWRICDANPEFMSPQEQLGKTPITITRFPVTFDEEDVPPPWSAVLKKLSEALGVLDVKLEEKIRLIPDDIVHNEQTLTRYRQQFEWTIVVMFNRLNVSRHNLITLLVAEGLGVGEPEAVGRVGKQIVIPPNL